MMGVMLVSISQITSTGSTVIFTGNIYKIYTKNQKVIGEIQVKEGLYRVYMSNSMIEAYATNTEETMLIYELHHV